MQQFRRFGRLVLIVALALVAAACEDGPEGSTSEEPDEEPVEVAETGQSGPPAQPIDVVATAVTKTEDAGSSAFELTGTSTAAGFTTDISANGTFDYTTGDGEMTITTENPGVGELALEERIVDGVVYMDFGDVPGFGAGWVSIDVSEAFGTDGAGNTIGAQPNPTEQLDQLRAAGDVEEIGTEEIRGEETTHYFVVLDYQTIVDEGFDALGEALSDEDVEFFNQLLGETSGDSTVEVWINAEGLPVRYSVVSSLEIEGLAVESDLTMEFFDFGVDVSPEAPPAEETTDFNELFGGLGGDIVQVPEGVPGGGGGT